MKARRLPVVDEYVEDGEAAIFVGDRVVVLSLLATRAVELLGDGWVELADVAAGLLDAFGAPPNDPTGLQATLAALQTLEVQDLVQLSPND